MGNARQLTRMDATTLLLGVLLLLNLAAVGQSGRGRAKQAVCLANLRQLASAWITYAGDNDGRIVNAQAGFALTTADRTERSWVGKCWDGFTTGVQLPKAFQQTAIRWGTLWPYVEEVRLYSCPEGYPGELLTYSIVDSMNGMSRDGTFTGPFLSPDAKGIRIGDTVLFVKNLAEIVSPSPAQRMVFIDQGWATPGSHSVHYRTEAWWTPPPVRHWDGTSATFADGHAEHWRWQGQETILNGRPGGPLQFSKEYTLPTPEDREDLHRLQTAVWGRLGY